MPSSTTYPAITVNSSVVTSNPSAGFTTFNTSTAGGTNGMGVFAYASSLQGFQAASATINLTATAPGVFTYTPNAADSFPITQQFSQITITAITCPTITGNSATECESGSLVSLVSGGHSPYYFLQPEQKAAER